MGQLGCGGTPAASILMGQRQEQGIDALNAAHYFGQHVFVWKCH